MSPGEAFWMAFCGGALKEAYRRHRACHCMGMKWILCLNPRCPFRDQGPWK